jgi:hypothetical protein
VRIPRRTRVHPPSSLSISPWGSADLRLAALPMAERCSFLSYEAVDEILEQPNLLHLPETIIEDYKEYHIHGGSDYGVRAGDRLVEQQACVGGVMNSR